MKIRLDISTLCQLKCPLCPNSKGTLKNTPLKYGTLSLNNFKQFVDKNPNITEIEISNYGEVFLNKDLSGILEYAFQKGIQITVYNGTNLNTATHEQLESVVRFGVRILNISLDGATQETYSKYRISGNFDRVIEHIKTINFYKEKYNSEFPKLTWQFVIFQHNIHEIEDAYQLAKSLDMEFFLKDNWDSKNRIKVPEEYTKHISTLGPEEVAGNNILDNKIFHDCLQMWQKPQINWNGEVLGCCINFWHSYGNAFADGLENVLNNKIYTNTQKLLLGKVFEKDSPCLNCGFFKATILKKYWLKYFIISPLYFTLYNVKKTRLYKKIYRKITPSGS